MSHWPATERRCHCLETRPNRLVLSEEDLSLGVLFLAQNERSAPLNGVASFELHFFSFSLVHNSDFKLKCRFLGELGRSTQDGFGLASETPLLGVVAALSLSLLGVSALLVLGNLPCNVFTCFSAVSAHCFWVMHL